MVLEPPPKAKVIQGLIPSLVMKILIFEQLNTLTYCLFTPTQIHRRMELWNLVLDIQMALVNKCSGPSGQMSRNTATHRLGRNFKCSSLRKVMVQELSSDMLISQMPDQQQTTFLRLAFLTLIIATIQSASLMIMVIHLPANYSADKTGGVLEFGHQRFLIPEARSQHLRVIGHRYLLQVKVNFGIQIV